MQNLNLLAAAIVLVRGLLAITSMCPGTPLAIRATWIVLTFGAAAIIMVGAPPDWLELLMRCGIAALVCAGPRGLTFCSTGDKS